MNNAVVILIISMILVFIVDKFFFSIVTVEGDSMQRTFYDGDKVLLKKIGIKSDDIEVDDIISFKGTDGKHYLKRVIGKHGDVIEVVNDKVLVNGVQKIEDYIKGEKTQVYSQNKWFVRDDEFFVLGDNRLKDSSKDSRIFGNIKIDQIEGKVIHGFN